MNIFLFGRCNTIKIIKIINTIKIINNININIKLK